MFTLNVRKFLCHTDLLKQQAIIFPFVLFQRTDRTAEQSKYFKQSWNYEFKCSLHFCIRNELAHCAICSSLHGNESYAYRIRIMLLFLHISKLLSQ